MKFPEKIGYKWAAQCLKPIEDQCEAHRLQQAADKIVAALSRAYETGYELGVADEGMGVSRPRT